MPACSTIPPGKKSGFVLLILAVAFLAAALPPVTAYAELEEERSWELFPDRGRAFEPLGADPREAAFTFGFLYDDDGDWYEDLNFGFDFGFLWLRLGPETTMTFTGRGIFTSRFDMFSDSFDLLNIDYVGGLAHGLDLGDHEFEAFVYHQSSHLGDEILDRGERRRIDYGREALRLLWGYRVGDFRFYLGGTYNFHAEVEDIDGAFWAQTGFEYRFAPWGQPMFAGLNLHAQEEHDFSPDVTLRYGVDLGDPAVTENRQQVFVQYYNGHMNLGQFWDEWEAYVMIGAAYRFR
ncbi:MAG: DUF1207 domain-containing protein [Desulfatibacillaceae bacterium]